MAQAPAPPVTLPGTLPVGLPLLLYGVRMWAAVCLALFVAFRLELDNPFWAGTSAAIVCQPVLGASLRKGWFRLIGTIIGAIAIVALTAAFPQNRAGFLIALALWGAACALAATLLRNFASYAAALAGYTTAIVAGDELGLVGGVNGEAFNLALTRATEICIGILCAGFVLASTDLGGARRRLAILLRTLAQQVLAGLLTALERPGAGQGASRPARRALLQRASALHIVMDQAAGEISNMPFRPRAMQRAVDGLFAALSAWRIVATHLERTPVAQEHEEAARVLACMPPALRTPWRGLDPVTHRNEALSAARELIALPAATASLRLLADRTAEGLFGIARTLNGAALLDDPAGREARPRVARLRVPDLMPAVVNAIRAFVTIGVADVVWIETGWPGGATFIMFAAITITLFAPREDAAYGMAANFMLGTALTTAAAGVIGFAVLPAMTTFLGFCLAIGLVLVPAGALSAQTWRQPLFTAFAANFIPLLGPANTMTYDPGAFYNSALALLAGCGLAMLMLRLIPPLPPAYRARRLLSLTLRELRRMATAARVGSTARWESRVYGRLGVMPPLAAEVQGARLATALTVGSEVLRLRRMAARFGVTRDLAPALAGIAAGNSAAAVEGLDRFEQAVAAVPPDTPAGHARLRMRATARAVAEALPLYASYFDAQELR
jgi:uncharacterized membrane protein YccC